jgi:hypothetical protein
MSAAVMTVTELPTCSIGVVVRVAVTTVSGTVVWACDPGATATTQA